MISAKENLLRAIAHDQPEYVPYLGEGVIHFLDHRGRRPPVEGVDEWGVTWQPLPAGYTAGADEPAGSCAVEPGITTAAALLARPFPAGDDPALFSGLALPADRSATLAVGRHPAGPLDRLVTLMGMLPALMALVKEPDNCRQVLDRIAAYHAAIARGYLAAGAEAGWLADDFAGSRWPLVAPDTWRRLVLPGLVRVIEVYREAGRPVFFHTCGRADALIPDLVAAGVTAFNLEAAASDLPQLVRRLGRSLSIVGGVSAGLLQRATAAQVASAAWQAMCTLGADGGLVLGPDQPLAIPAASEAALYATARSRGRYPLDSTMAP